MLDVADSSHVTASKYIPRVALCAISPTAATTAPRIPPFVLAVTMGTPTTVNPLLPIPVTPSFVLAVAMRAATIVFTFLPFSVTPSFVLVVTMPPLTVAPLASAVDL